MKTTLKILTLGFLLISLENTAQNFGPQNIIESNTGVNPIEVFWADFNGDGLEDALLGSYNNQVVWYENDGMGGFGTPQTVLTTPFPVTAAKAADLNGDGFIDVYCAYQDGNGFLLGGVTWMQNDGTGNFGPPQNIGFLISGPQAIDAGDYDNDGDLDVAVAISFEGEFSWFENVNGTFATEHVLQSVPVGAPLQLITADLDNDGDDDIVTYDLASISVSFHENIGGGNFNTPQVIVSSQSGTVRLSASDMNGDSHIDLITSSTLDDNISWWENDGTNVFSTQHVIYGIPGLEPASIFCSDIDFDGDEDIVWGDALTTDIFWQANNGSGSFSIPNLITNASDGTIALYVADVEGDGDMDILSGSFNDNKIAWYENNPIVLGCTSMTACNYNVAATVDDGTCIEPVGCQICSGQTNGTGVVINIDNDGDGICDPTDPDDDNDGVLDANDINPFDPFTCQDLDNDGCDDCSIGIDGFGPANDFNPLNDGPDLDADGLCDSGDSDDDNDGVLDINDTNPADPFVCQDLDSDGCDDCSVGTDGFGPLADFDPMNDGFDPDGDGLCNAVVSGCTSPTACNYNILANLDDGSCAEPMGCEYCSGQTNGTGIIISGDCDGDGVCDPDEVYGCTLTFAQNYDPLATEDDGSCIEKCLGDFNNDSVISAADLLAFLGLLGTPCPQ